jgi:hypothetical protein
MDAFVDLLPVLPWYVLVLCSVVSVMRSVDRHFEWKRWCCQPSFRFLGRELPPYFPVDLLADQIFFTTIRNCVLNECNGRQRIALDLELTRWGRHHKWLTIVAVEGRFTEEHPWTNPSSASALQGGGWVVFQPREPSLANKPLFWRFVDAIPAGDRLLEIEAVRSLWREAEPILIAVEQETPREPRVVHDSRIRIPSGAASVA